MDKRDGFLRQVANVKRSGASGAERAGERHERTQAVGLKEWRLLHSAERDSEFTAAGRRAGPKELHPKFELAESMAVPNRSSDPSEV